jgi:hypothetical protein
MEFLLQETASEKRTGVPAYLNAIQKKKCLSEFFERLAFLVTF